MNWIIYKIKVKNEDENKIQKIRIKKIKKKKKKKKQKIKTQLWIAISNQIIPKLKFRIHPIVDHCFIPNHNLNKKNWWKLARIKKKINEKTKYSLDLLQL